MTFFALAPYAAEKNVSILPGHNFLHLFKCHREEGQNYNLKAATFSSQA